ncbi:unnamed protein product [marine sediment metagenome]|uniref:Hydroxylamine reductase n=1 Tax=marine sediment metagenome TaxID=412755 RepID=X0YXR4_9ZZZZ
MTDKMFCYQCQETAKGSGCTVRGVCGKTDDVGIIDFNREVIIIKDMAALSKL